MTVRAIRLFGDPVLRQKCRPVSEFNEGLHTLVTDLMDTCRVPGRAGVAAPQIGVALRVFSYNVDGVEGYVINPEVVELDGHDEGLEGCLSIPDLECPTPRAARAVVRGVDLEGRPVELEGSGLFGRCLQHETDHLDGHLYVDRLDGPLRKQLMSVIRNRQISGEQ